jgi:hypothetical protein
VTGSRRHRALVLVGLMLLWFGASVIAGTRLEAHIAADSLLGRCSKADAEGSSFDVGRTSVEWFPPGVRCSWDGRYPDEKWFPAGGIGIVAAALAGCFAFPTLLWWLVRRAKQKVMLASD